MRELLLNQKIKEDKSFNTKPHPREAAEKI